MSVTNPTKMVEPFAVNAGSTFITSPFPVPSQIPLGSPGKASLNDGFTPLNMTSIGSGGIPMSGPDLNGILNLISQTTVAVNAGQVFLSYDATYQTTIGGYAIGAVIVQDSNPLAYWVSTIAANATNPNIGGAGWMSTVPLHTTVTAASGATHDKVLPNPSDQFYDINTAAGAATFDSFVPQRDGQKLTITCTGANVLTVGGTGGTAANRIRQSAPVSLLQNDSMSIQYCLALLIWVVV